MESFQSKVVKSILAVTKYDFKKIQQLRLRDHKKPPIRFMGELEIEEHTFLGVTCYELIPKKKIKEKTILYLHGGAYVCGPSMNHWRMLSKICGEEGYRIIAVDYKVAPEHPFPTAFYESLAVYEGVAQIISPQDLIIMGDSAGGGLALAVLMKIRNEGKRLPYKGVLLSPWLDVTMSNPDIEKYQGFDKMLEKESVLHAAKCYAGKYDPHHPYISPIKGDIKGLPPLLMMVGTHDILYPDCEQLHQKALKAGVDLTYSCWPEMIHIFMTLTGMMPEADDAISEIIRYIEEPIAR